MEISDSFMYYNQVDGTRTDLSVLNIESATQKWFHRRHKLFKDVKFAGMRFSNNTNLPSEFSINGMLIFTPKTLLEQIIILFLSFVTQFGLKSI